MYALAQRTFLVLIWMGFLALFRGFSQIMLAFSIRHARTGDFDHHQQLQC